jgi:hypothetical protein
MVENAKPPDGGHHGAGLAGHSNRIETAVANMCDAIHLSEERPRVLALFV